MPLGATPLLVGIVVFRQTRTLGLQ